MKNNSLSIIVLILVVLAGVLYWRANFVENKDKRLNAFVVKSENLANMDEIQISGDKGVIVLKKGDDYWKVASDSDFPAQAQMISQLIDSLASVKLERVVAKTKVSHKDFGIDKGKRVKILKNSQELLNIVVGDSRDGGGQYISYSEEEVVYLSNTNVNLVTAGDDWLYKNLLKIPRKNIKNIGVVFTKPKKSFTLTRSKAEEEFKLTANNNSSIKDKNLPSKLSNNASSLIELLSFFRKENIPARAEAGFYAQISYELFNGQKYLVTVEAATAQNQSLVRVQLDPKAPVTKNSDGIEISKWFIDNQSKYSFYINKVDFNL